jgi:uncharacterized repeat protein (TIGR01451 family)
VITESQEWCAVDSPHQLTGDVTVNAGVTLIIQPGVTVKGSSGSEIKVLGDLKALGTFEEPIIFTSVSETKGTWAGLVFDGGTGDLRHTTVRYSGQSNSAGIRSNIAVLNTVGGEVHMQNCQVLESYDAAATEYGMYVNNGITTISDTLFSGNGNGGAAAPFYITGADSVVTLTGNSITGNSRDRIVLAAGAMMGHDTTLSPQTVLQGYELASDFTVPPNITLTIQPGVTVMGGSEIELKVQGDLQAIGTVENPIIFTSVSDTKGTWAGLVFDGGTGDLRHTTVRYSGQGNSAGVRSNITVQNTVGGEVHMQNCQVLESYDAAATEYGMYVNNGITTISDTLFSGNGNGGAAAPFYITGADSVVTLTGNSITGNSRDRIVLTGQAMMGQDATLAPQTELQGYELASDLIVPAHVTLTIQPGVTVMGADGTELTVQGDLQAIGTTENPIIFTSVADSAGGQWSGLVFDGGTGDLSHTTVRFGGLGNSVGIQSNIAVWNTLSGEVHLESCMVQNSSGSTNRGLDIRNGLVSVDNTEFSSAYLHLHIDGDSTVVVNGSVIQGASSHGVLVEGDLAWLHIKNSMILSNGAFTADGVRNTGKATVILSGDPDQGNFIASNQEYGANQTGLNGQIFATYNYWGDPSGPTHPNNPAGTGEPVSDRVLFDPWLTEAPTPALSTDFVLAFGPRYVSPGETVNFGFIVHNLLSETLTNSVVVAHLPQEIDYLLSTLDGEYWPDRHQVVWKLGNLAADEVVYLVVQVRFKWGLPLHHKVYPFGSIVATNLESDLLELDEYLAFEPLNILSFEELTEQEFSDILAADPELNALYDDGLSQGFVYYGGASLEHLSDGSDQVSLVLIDTSKPGEEMHLHQIIDGVHRIHAYPDSALGDSPTVSYDYNYQSGETTLWNPFWPMVGPFQQIVEAPCSVKGCDNYYYPDCVRNCMINNIHSNQFNPAYSKSCARCYKYGYESACNACALSMKLWRNDIIKETVNRCEKSCWEDENGWKCDKPTRECSTSHVVMITPCQDCEYNTENIYYELCGSNERCVQGICKKIKRPTEVVTAGDPNDMVGPMEVIPNQTITYTIHFENVGAGTAYGVFIESQLPEIFNANTLQIADDGIFLSSPRILLWEVGELSPGEEGQVSFQVKVPNDAVSGSVIFASATVYFPSVPETTPTNQVMSIVRDVVADAQYVETVEGTPVDFTLTGSTPTGNPLVFELLRSTLWGNLTGTYPNLTYTPEDGFEGGDNFSFSVSDGVNTSLPAEVSIHVATGTESIPPEVLFTIPTDSAVNVPVYQTPWVVNEYLPSIWAQFSEPVDAATVTTQTLIIRNEEDQQIACQTDYDSVFRRVKIQLLEPLMINQTYTVTLTTGIFDTSGNPLVSNYSWSFTTGDKIIGQQRIFLPLIVSNK